MAGMFLRALQATAAYNYYEGEKHLHQYLLLSIHPPRKKNVNTGTKIECGGCRWSNLHRYTLTKKKVHLNIVHNKSATRAETSCPSVMLWKTIFSFGTRTIKILHSKRAAKLAFRYYTSKNTSSYIQFSHTNNQDPTICHFPFGHQIKNNSIQKIKMEHIFL